MANPPRLPSRRSASRFSTNAVSAASSAAENSASIMNSRGSPTTFASSNIASTAFCWKRRLRRRWPSSSITSSGGSAPASDNAASNWVNSFFGVLSSSTIQSTMTWLPDSVMA